MNQFQKTNKKLNSLRSTSFLVGLIVACSFTFLAFEWTTSSKIDKPERPTDSGMDEINELPPLTYRNNIKPPEVKIEQQKPNLDEIIIIKEDPIESTDKKEPIIVVSSKFNPDEWSTVGPPVDPPLPPAYTAGVMPHFLDCKSLPEEERRTCTDGKIIEHFSRTTHIPEDIKMRGKAEYIAYVYYEVNTKGIVTNVKILNDKKHKIPKSLEREAYNTVKSLPLFIPGNNHGKKVVVRYQVPIKFTVK